MQGRVIYTGQALIDLVMPVAGLPPRGGDVYATRFDMTPGGGFNVMAAAARDGGEVIYLGATGTGPFGEQVRAALASEGVQVANPPVPGIDTGISVAMVEPDGERTFVSGLGAEGRVDLTHLNAITIKDTDIVHVCGYSLGHEINANALASWLGTIPKAATVVFDPAPLVMEIGEAAWQAIIQRATIWTLNAREARLVMTRLGVAEEIDDPRVLAGCLASMLAATVLVRDGARGGYLSNGGVENGEGAEHGGGVEHIEAVPVSAVDTNGAGDAHCGVLMAALARGLTLPCAVRRANIAAAIAVTRPGPATSPRAEEIDRGIAVGVGR